MFTGTIATVLGALLDRIGPDTVRGLARQVVNDRKNSRTKSLVDFSEKVALAYSNAQYDIAINGEKWLLERLVQFSPKTMIDVGANRGEWCITAHRSNPEATIHAFEIVGETCDLLIENPKAFRSRIVVNGFGLSDENGSVDVYHAPGADVHSSFLEDAHMFNSDGAYVRLSRPVRTGDDYLAERNIAKVDMLKIDVEGAEPMVLDGFRNALSQHEIDIIQFEYGKHRILTLLSEGLLRQAGELRLCLEKIVSRRRGVQGIRNRR